jgi:hypothetical protein
LAGDRGDIVNQVMTSKTVKRKQRDAVPKVGSIVGVRTAGGKVIRARVIEDRGNLGVNGRRIVRLEVDVTYSDPVRFERPVELLLPAPA